MLHYNFDKTSVKDANKLKLSGIKILPTFKLKKIIKLKKQDNMYVKDVNRSQEKDTSIKKKT